MQISLNMSEVDEKGSTHRRHFDKSINASIRVLSCLAAQSNLDLPAYSYLPQYPVVTQAYECGLCEGCSCKENLAGPWRNCSNKHIIVPAPNTPTGIGVPHSIINPPTIICIEIKYLLYGNPIQKVQRIQNSLHPFASALEPVKRPNMIHNMDEYLVGPQKRPQSNCLPPLSIMESHYAFSYRSCARSNDFRMGVHPSDWL